MIAKEIQIKVLLYGDAFHFACETLGVINMLNQSYSDVFTVSEEEVYEYTLTHGLPYFDSTSKYSLAEGFHYFLENGKWITFFRERGLIHTEKDFDNDELGRRYIIRTLLQLAGTGVY